MVNENEIDYEKLEIDKQNSSVYYNDAVHKYWTKDGAKNCISVTTLIHKYTTFDTDFWSKYKAIQVLLGEDEFDGPIIGKQKIGGVTKDKRSPASKIKQYLLDTKKYTPECLSMCGLSHEDVLKETESILKDWDEKRETSCIRGTAIHKAMEEQHVIGNTEELQYLGLGGEFKTNTTNKIEFGKQGVYPELLLSRISDDGELRIAGQADLIIVDGEDVYILDYKTGKKIDQKSYYDSKKKRSETLKYPLNNLQDCNFIHYSLQLSTYAWMIQKEYPNANIKELILIHYDHDGGVTNYKCDYLKNDVERMLAYYKQEMKYEEFRKRREKITF